MNYDPNLVASVEDNASEYIDKVNNLLAQYGVVDKDGRNVYVTHTMQSTLLIAQIVR